MPPYIFRPPADAPAMTYENLKGLTYIGTTIMIIQRVNYLDIRLYHTTIAQMNTDGSVCFPIHDFSTQATRYWLEQIVRDNFIGSCVYRVRKPASMRRNEYDRSMYAIDGDKDKPVEGYTYRGRSVHA